MGSEELIKIFVNCECKPAASGSLIDDAKSRIGNELPNDYIQFLMICNGAEGFISPGSYVMLWSIEDAIKWNQDYQVDEFAPGFFIFGSDGGGEAFAFDWQSKGAVVLLPFVGMSRDGARRIATTFSSFIQRLQAGGYSE